MPEEHVFHVDNSEAQPPRPQPEDRGVEKVIVLDASARSSAADRAAPVSSRTEEEMQRLRSLLLQDEIDKIRDLEHRLNDQATKATEVSDVIAEAVVMRSGKDTMLTKAFEPIVETSLKESLRKNPNDFINVFFPLIGSTIRRSISESFNSMLGSFSKSMELSLSLKGIQWRLEGWRTGKSFSEVVMLHTLVYRVDQVFLIHSETGLVLSHVVNEGVTSRDADMVSGMLTAIQDFARDCFNNDGDNSALNSLKMDEYTIYIVQSPLAYLACVVRGTPPADFLDRLNENLELSLAECADFFADFKGDAAPFQVANKYLNDCLSQKFVDDDKPVPVWAKWSSIGVACLFVLLLFAKWYHSYRMDNGVDILRKEPGLLVVDVKSNWGLSPWKVVCLQDELARPMEQILGENGYDPDDIDIHSIPFVSHEPEVIRLRVAKKILPPEGVEVGYKNGVLFLSGTADMNWILQARQTALATPGVLSVDTSELHDPRVAELTALINAIETATVRFPTGSDAPIPGDQRAFNKVISDLVAVDRLAKQMGLSVSLTIYGQADATGSDRRNYEISQARARSIASKLYAQQASISIVLYGIGADLSHGDGEKRAAGGNLDKRKIDLKVRLVRMADADQLPVIKK